MTTTVYGLAQGLQPPDNDDWDGEEREPSPGAWSRDTRSLLRDFELVRLLCNCPEHFIERMKALAAGSVVDIPMSQQAGSGPSEDMILVPTSPAERRAAGKLEDFSLHFSVNSLQQCQKLRVTCGALAGRAPSEDMVLVPLVTCGLLCDKQPAHNRVTGHDMHP